MTAYVIKYMQIVAKYVCKMIYLGNANLLKDKTHKVLFIQVVCDVFSTMESI